MNTSSAPKKTGVLFLALSFCIMAGCSSSPSDSVIVHSPLPYAENALEPYMSGKTLSLHHGVHHAAYVKNACLLLEQTGIDGNTPEEIIKEISGNKKYQDVFNQVAQAYNHDFFWKCLKPQGGGKPQGELLKRIESSFGSFEAFRQAFTAQAKSVFGSGWIFLVQDGDNLEIMTTSNADTPVAHDRIPLFTVDVWEHSYYIDYQNKRSEYVEAVLDHLANWEFVEKALR